MSAEILSIIQEYITLVTGVIAGHLLKVTTGGEQTVRCVYELYGIGWKEHHAFILLCVHTEACAEFELRHDIPVCLEIICDVQVPGVIVCF